MDRLFTPFLVAAVFGLLGAGLHLRRNRSPRWRDYLWAVVRPSGVILLLAIATSLLLIVFSRMPMLGFAVIVVLAWGCLLSFAAAVGASILVLFRIAGDWAEK